jgi:hypothetical protein
MISTVTIRALANEPDYRSLSGLRTRQNISLRRSTVIRTRDEVRQLVSEFVNSGVRRSEVLPEPRFELQHAGPPSEGAVEEEDEKRSLRWQVGGSGIGRQETAGGASCGLAVVLSGGRRIEVQRDFNVRRFERLVSVLERV